ncbi:MAG: rhamnan synthesis F family protein [Lachnospiraceae bacterium]|nr:rhamnan synthesis F family protein [Lachnospiraceae bacterium]
MLNRKRLGVFVIYDANGIIDEYIPYLLSDIIQNLDRLVIVCNGSIDDSGMEVLSKYSNEIIIRENEGFDGGAYKYVLTEYIRRNNADEFDDIVLFNDTFYGPFYPFSEVFSYMDDKSCDFWGLSMHGCFYAYNQINSKHVQSFFLVIRHSVTASDSFWDFWKEMQTATNIDKAVINYEISLSKNLIEAGFVPGAYLQMECYLTDNPERNMDYCQLKAGECIAGHGFPILKRKSFLNQEGIEDNHELKTAIRYIYNTYDYPIDYIFSSLFRKEELGLIYRSFGLNMEFSGRQFKLDGKMSFLIVVCDCDGEIMEDIGKSIDRITYQYSEVEIVVIKQDPVLFIIDKLKTSDRYDYVCLIQNEEWIASEHRQNRARWRDYHFSCSLLKERITDYLGEVSALQKTFGIMFPQPTPKDLKIKFSSSKDVYNRVGDYLKTKDIKFRCNNIDNIVFSFKSFWCEIALLQELLKLYEPKYHEAWFDALPYLAQYFGRGMNYLSGCVDPDDYINMYEKIIRNFC